MTASTAKPSPSAGAGDGSFHGHGADGEVARGFVQHEQSDLAEDAAKFLRARALIAQAGEVVLDERVRDDGDVLHQRMKVGARK